MEKDKKLTFYDYLHEREIDIVGDFNYMNEFIDEDKVKKQIDCICNFHKVAMEYTGNYTTFYSKSGKIIEKYKMWIKNLKRTVNSIENKSDINALEKIIYKSSKVYIKRAEECLDMLKTCNYMELLKRSMKRNEICLGNTYFNNIRQKELLEIGNLDRCAYNMVEIDGVYLMGKLKRNGYKFDYRELIKYFCKVEGLKDDSCMFIMALVSYPHEYMKYCERLRLNKKFLSDDYYKMKIKNSMKKDGITLLSEVKVC